MLEDEQESKHDLMRHMHITIKLQVEHNKTFYSVNSGNNWCSFFAKIYLGELLYRKF